MNTTDRLVVGTALILVGGYLSGRIEFPPLVGLVLGAGGALLANGVLQWRAARRRSDVGGDPS